MVEQNSNQGGGDPISAIANAVGDIANAVGNIIVAKNARKSIEQQFRNLQIPKFQDILLPYQSSVGNQNIIIIAVLAIIIITMIIVIALTKNKKPNEVDTSGA